MLLKWYDSNKRILPWRENLNPYAIWISEVMLQQTRVNTVIPYYIRWIKKFPTIRSVARADLNLLFKLWEGLGYYSRCKNFYKASQIVENKYKGTIPDNYSLFRKLPGVGDYIAGAVMSIAFNKNYPAIDGNIKRVISRYLGIKNLTKRNVVRINNELKKNIIDQRPGDINQALMDIGSLICKPMEALCPKCPLIDNCKGFISGNPIIYPTKNKRKSIPTKEFIVVLISYNNQILINHRKDGGLLGGLWELPITEISNNCSKIDTMKKYVKNKYDFSVNVINQFDNVSHSYSHYKLLVTLFVCEIKNINLKVGHWINIDEIDEYAFSKINHKLFDIIGIKNS
jgi:A/G-specific adenine glycosylase